LYASAIASPFEIRPDSQFDLRAIWAELHRIIEKVRKHLDDAIAVRIHRRQLAR